MAPTPVFVGLGSNLDDPLDHVRRAIAELEILTGTRLAACSPLYKSEAIGPPGQPDYINAVAELETTLSPPALLAELQAIENRHGRVREERWGARTLDLDILLFGDLRIATETLHIPHPELARRNFVLFPLADLSPGLVLPDGTALTDLLANVPTAGIVPLADGD